MTNDPIFITQVELANRYGVAYRTDAKDYGLIINYCPWCGGRPGRVHAGKEPK